MKPYGFIITDAGRALIAGWSAGEISSSLALAEIMVGTGTPPDGAALDSLYQLSGLIAPFAPATSDVPFYDGDTIHMTIEYRSDMNGGLEQGLWLSEFGIFVEHPSVADKKILFGYGTLGDKPQYVSAYNTGSLDSRRFPVSITVGAGVEVSVLYDTAAFMTARDVGRYGSDILLPMLLEETEALIARHNTDPLSHLDIRNLISDVAGRVARLEDMLVNNITGNPFLVAFAALDGIETEGVWNKPQQRIEF